MSRPEIDLSALPFPDAVEQLDFETILAERMATLREMDPDLTDFLALESEPLVMLLQDGSFRELIWRGRANDSVRSVMLALATGADLDQLVALLGVQRQAIVEADPDADPPVAAVYEDDASLRRRAQLSWEGMTVAGTVGAYAFHTLSADGRVRDVAVSRPQAGVVQVTILSHDDEGAPSAELIGVVEAALSDIRPLCDDVRVVAPVFVDFAIEAVLIGPPGPGAEVILSAARDAVTAYVQDEVLVGRVVRHGAVLARLYQPGVEAVRMTTPLADIDPGRTGVARATSITISYEVAT